MGETGTITRSSRHTPEQVICKLREGDRMSGEGRSIAEVCKRELERENARLKRIVADQALETQALKAINRGTSEPGPPAPRGLDAPGPPRESSSDSWCSSGSSVGLRPLRRH